MYYHHHLTNANWLVGAGRTAPVSRIYSLRKLEKKENEEYHFYTSKPEICCNSSFEPLPNDLNPLLSVLITCLLSL